MNTFSGAGSGVVSGEPFAERRLKGWSSVLLVGRCRFADSGESRKD